MYKLYGEIILIMIWLFGAALLGLPKSMYYHRKVSEMEASKR